jgi:hypothetical protein
MTPGALLAVAQVLLAAAWSGEAHVGAALDYAGWGDGRRFLVLEPGVLLEGARGPLSFALAASAAADLYRQDEGGRFPPTLRLVLRMGVQRPTWRLRLGPAYHGNDRGGRGYRQAFIPLGNADWRYTPAGARYFYQVEAGARATGATVGEGLHLGFGWRLPAGGAVQEVLGALYLGKLVGLSARITSQAWIVSAQVGVDPLQRGQIFHRGAIGFGASVGRAFGTRAAPDAPGPVVLGEVPSRHTFTAALAALWRRNFAAEYQHTFAPRLAFFGALGLQDHMTEASLRVRGPWGRLGLRVFPFANAPTGWWVAWDTLTLGWLRSSGWRSPPGKAGPLGPYRDSQGDLLASGVSLGHAWQWRGVALSAGLGAQLGLHGYDQTDGRRRTDAALSPTARLNLGVAF